MYKNMQQKKYWRSRRMPRHQARVPWAIFQKMKRKGWSYSPYSPPSFPIPSPPPTPPPFLISLPIHPCPFPPIHAILSVGNLVSQLFLHQNWRAAFFKCPWYPRVCFHCLTFCYGLDTAVLAMDGIWMEIYPRYMGNYIIRMLHSLWLSLFLEPSCLSDGLWCERSPVPECVARERERDLHPSKKVTQHDFDRLYFFYPGFVFIKLDPWKACLFAFRLMPYLLGLFHWGVCRVSKLGAMSKRKSCKINRIVWKMHAMSCLCFPLVTVCTRTHCPFIVPKSEETKHAEFQIVVQFWNICFLTLRLI